MLPITSGDTAYAVKLFYNNGTEIVSPSFTWGLSSSIDVEPSTWYSSIEYSCPIQGAPNSFYYDSDYRMFPYYVTPSGCSSMIALGLSCIWVNYNGTKGSALITGDNYLSSSGRVIYETITLAVPEPPTPDTGDTPTTIEVTYTGNTSVDYNSGSTHFDISGSTTGNFSIISSSSWAAVLNYTRTGTYTASFDLFYDTNTGDTRTSRITITLASGGSSGRAFFFFTQEGADEPQVITSITANVPSIVIDEGQATYTVSPTGLSTSISWSSSDTGKAIIDNSGHITVISPGVVDFTVTDSISNLSSTSRAEVRISLPEPDNIPVWKDTVFTYQGEEYYDYDIYINGVKAYSGRNHIIDADTGIYVNDIAKDFVENHFETTPGNWKANNFSILLEVEVDGNIQARYRFYKDYSYEDVEGSIICLNDPIRNEVPEGCIIPFSFLSVDGTSSGITIGSSVLNLDSYSSGNLNIEAEEGTYEAPGVSYKTIPGCGKEVLYYENAFGGYDVFVPKWVRKKTDEITSYTLDQAYNNTTRQYENRRYLNISSPSWEFNTGWLTDEQSSKMHHLIESNEIYLYKEGRFIPVVATDSRLEYRTWYNNGKKPVNYTITLKESQGKERR